LHEFDVGPSDLTPPPSENLCNLETVSRLSLKAEDAEVAKERKNA
jgi:hypothetical protein